MESNPKLARIAAARCGADAVLLIEGASQVDSYVNPISTLNIAILPGFIVPASHRDALFMIKGVLMDVRDESLYTVAEAEGEGKVMGPSFTIREEIAIHEAKGKALKTFGEELRWRLMNLRGALASAR